MNQIESINKTMEIERQIKEVQEKVKAMFVNNGTRYEIIKASEREIVVRIWLV